MGGTESITREKAQLREKLLRRREALGEGERRRSGAAAAEKLLALPEVAGARRIFTCLSFETELDTWGLVERWLAEGREVYVPRADRTTGLLHVHRYPCALATLSFGLRQPRRAEPELAREAIDSTLDVAIVLGVGFDRRGFRLGYGSGFFDRFLAGRPFPAVGLTFADQLVERLPAAPHDVPMRTVVSEVEVVRPEPTEASPS
jgi:5-formyltetrahydrofolate cyclo-ligase